MKLPLVSINWCSFVTFGPQQNAPLNSLTPKSVLVDMKNSRSEGFWLANHKHANILTMMEPFSLPAAWF
jgi:hypothetical protein